jgi:hypothetical protein
MRGAKPTRLQGAGLRHTDNFVLQFLRAHSVLVDLEEGHKLSADSAEKKIIYSIFLKQWLSITTCCHVLAATVNYVHVNI